MGASKWAGAVQTVMGTARQVPAAAAAPGQTQHCTPYQPAHDSGLYPLIRCKPHVLALSAAGATNTHTPSCPPIFKPHVQQA